MVAGLEVHAVPVGDVSDAVAARCVPDRGVCHTPDVPSAQIGVRGLGGADLREDLLRRPAHAGVRFAGHAAVELEDAV